LSDIPGLRQFIALIVVSRARRSSKPTRVVWLPLVVQQMAGLLTPDARSFFEGLPALIPVWRGCEAGRERGISWTTDRKVARRFAIGQRCVNKTPTLVSAKIPRQHIFGVFVDRNEKEIVLNPRRLRSLFSELLEVSGETAR
jgi:hypothetical protein